LVPPFGTHWVSLLQEVLQLVLPQTYGAQLPVVAVEQAPPPEQNAVAMKVVPLHEAAPQLTLAAAWVQAPPPLQVPVLPQVAPTAHWPVGAVVPAAIAAQLPSPFTLQALQVPQGPEPQQTPSVQKPLMHWLAEAQA
jgi:hypothetical protein